MLYQALGMVLIKFATEDIAKTRFQTTTLPVNSHTELIGPISWHLKQRVGMHLFRTGMAFKFDRLYLCLGFSHSTSYTQGQCFFRERSTYTPPNRSCIAGGRFTGTPFQCGSGSVATVVLRDNHACELCDAPAQPTRCPLLPRESCSALVSMVQ